MKKIVALALTLVAALTFTGCFDDSDSVSIKLENVSEDSSFTLDAGGGYHTIEYTVDANSDLDENDVSVVVYDASGNNASSYFTVTPEDVVAASIFTGELQISAKQNCPGGVYSADVKATNGDANSSYSITITVNGVDPGEELTEEVTKSIHNPYGSMPSAYSIVDKSNISATINSQSGKMEYSSDDSLYIDIALDNSEYIRTTAVRKFVAHSYCWYKKVAASEYDNATDTSVATLVGDLAETSANQVVTDFAVGDVYALKLGGFGTDGMGYEYAIMKITAFDPDNTEGSDTNTGKLTFTYKYSGETNRRSQRYMQ